MMDDDENNAESREQLLQRFRDSLAKPMSDRFFDEDSLIEIFDYAGDLGDDFLRIEALMCGARFFPDSPELLERRGIFYSQYSDRARQQFLELGPQGEGMIFDLLALRDNPPTDAAEIRKCLDEIIERPAEILDEETIQLIETVNELGVYQWAKDRYKIIYDKVQYKQGLLYEMAMLAESFADYPYATALLEELTEIDPFNSYYWMVLARQHINTGDDEAALSAIDYSLAINPKAAESLYLKARLIHKANGDFKEIDDLCRKALENSNGNTDVARFRASIYHDNHDDATAVKILRKVLDDPNLGLEAPFSDPNSTATKELELIPDMVLLGADDSDALLDRFYQANSENTLQMWTSWASNLNALGQRETAQKVIQAFERNSGQHTTSIISVEHAFLNGDFDQARDGLRTLLQGQEVAPALYPSAMVLHILMLIKERDFDQARQFVYTLKNNLVDTGEFAAALRLEFYALNDIVARLEKLLNLDPPLPDSFWDSYNPLGY